MNVVKTAVICLVASGSLWLVVPAQAQESLQSSLFARDASHSSNVRAIQARRDQHAANVAAINGDFGAARAYAHAADVRQVQSDRDARLAHRADRAARIERAFGD